VKKAKGYYGREAVVVNLIGRFSQDYGGKFKEGYPVKIDRISGGPTLTGTAVRVVNEWARPRWFDSSWFN
jgi:hypothetical protein